MIAVKHKLCLFRIFLTTDCEIILNIVDSELYIQVLDKLFVNYILW